MKCRVIALLLLTAAAIGGLTGASAWLSGKQTALTYTQQTLAGSPAAAEGLLMTDRLQCGTHLQWETVLHPGETLTQEPAFHYQEASGGRILSSDRRKWSAGVCNEFSASGGFAPEELEQSLGLGEGFMTRPAADVASRTPPGESRTETVRLSDYYSFYLLSMEGFLRDWDTEDVSHALSSYLRIPVAPDVWMKVQVQLDEQGLVTDIECSMLHEQQIMCIGISTAEEDYVAVSVQDENGAPVFCEQAGVYRLMPEEKDGALTLAGERIYTMPESAAVRDFTLRGEDGALLLLCDEEASVHLTVLRGKTGVLVQKTALPALQEQVSFNNAVLLDRAILAYQYGERPEFVLLCQEGDSYCPVLNDYLDLFRDDMAEGQENLFGTPMAAYDGSRLALCERESGRYGLRFWLAIYDDSGLCYAGRYDCSLDLDSVYNTGRPYAQCVVPADDMGLELDFAAAYS